MFKDLKAYYRKRIAHLRLAITWPGFLEATATGAVTLASSLLVSVTLGRSVRDHAKQNQTFGRHLYGDGL
jgi:hypothetical protein